MNKTKTFRRRNVFLFVAAIIFITTSRKIKNVLFGVVDDTFDSREAIFP